ncbi:hypothetical protein [Bdellovibrio sp. HCB337]|uniref:hypothetical protein n=1 Tax=Bdellovibrio sp. HCB337 TaxID=3394358 RepID=UPI0039A5BC3A
MRLSAYIFAFVFALVLMNGQESHGKNGVQDPAKEAEKIAKDAEKAAKKAEKDAEKLAKKADRIDLIAKLKVEEPADDEEEVDVDISEPEVSLKYRKKADRLRLKAEAEGFADGTKLSIYVVINNAEILVTTLELVGDEVAAQEIEFDEATWPTGVPKDLAAGTPVRVKDMSGVVVLQGTLEAK